MEHFVNVSQEQLETWLAEAQADLAAGKTVTSAAAGDASSSNRVDKTPLARIELLYKELNLRDPDTYPLSKIARQSTAIVEFS